MEKKSWNKNLKTAKKSKNDEFYTQLPDIEKELWHYKEQLKWKIIFCNCDDPEESNFFRYFSLNFEYLWLKKLISTHFEEKKKSYKLEITRWLDLNNDWKIDFKDTVKTALKQNWDFRSPECIEILKECDIVISNPPFSLFREYIEQLFEYNKNFLLIWNMNAITYKEIFKLIKDNKIWSWYWFNLSMVFKSLYENNLEANKKFCEQKWYFWKNFIKTPAINWFTNLDTQKRHEDMILYKIYNSTEYPKYDNYDAINVDKVKDIPLDYKWYMWVPITFLNKHNPEQFEIIGLSRYIKTQWMSKEFVDKYYQSWQTGSISEWHPDLCYYDKNNKPIVPYMRILIKNKKL